jgi:hypothetical protein
MAFNDRIVLVKFVRWTSGTADGNISSRYARSVYSLNNKQWMSKYLGPVRMSTANHKTHLHEICMPFVNVYKI